MMLRKLPVLASRLALCYNPQFLGRCRSSLFPKLSGIG